MGNTNSNDTCNKLRNSHLKSPRKKFLKTKKSTNKMFHFNKTNSYMTNVGAETGRCQGHEVVNPLSIELRADEDEKQQVVVGDGYDVQFETNDSPLYSCLIGFTDGGEFNNIEHEQRRSVNAFKYEGGSSCTLDGNGDRVTHNPIFVVESDTEQSDKRELKELIKVHSNDSVENVGSEFVDLCAISKPTAEDVKKQSGEEELPKPIETNNVTVENIAQEYQQQKEENGAVNETKTSEIIQVLVDSESVDKKDDLSEEYSNTSYTDPLVTTPYYSPDEEIEKVFETDSSTEDMEMKSKGTLFKEDIPMGNTSPIKLKNDMIEKELLKTTSNSFIVIKHKKVELSPATFQSQKTNDTKGKFGCLDEILWKLLGRHISL